MREREHEHDEQRERVHGHASANVAAEQWASSAGNVAVQAAVRSAGLPTRANAGLDRLLARAPAARIQRQEADEEEEAAPAPAPAEAEAAPAPEHVADLPEVPSGPVAEKLMGQEDEEVELPE
jgi:hypothetical protein